MALAVYSENIPVLCCYVLNRIILYGIEYILFRSGSSAGRRLMGSEHNMVGFKLADSIRLGTWVAHSLAAIAFGIVSGAVAGCPEYTVERAQSVTVTPDENLREVLRTVVSNTVVYLADGVYTVESNLQITADRITLRSSSGNRDGVILDGNGGAGSPLDRERFVPEVIAISGSDVHLVDISVRHARDHAIHLYAPAEHSISGCMLHNLHVYDCGEQLIKVNSNGNSSAPCWVDSGVLEGSLIEFTDNSVMEDMGDYFYTGGLDVHGGEGWIVRWNTFRNIEREGKLMEHAVHFWSRSRGSIVENNRFENCYRAIGFGMKQAPDGLVREYSDGAGEEPYLDHIDGIIRNNVIFNKAGVHLETGIELMNVASTGVYHNTVYSTDEPFNCIEYRWPDTRVVIVNNLTSHRIMERNDAQGELSGNVTGASASFFVDVSGGDVHLAAGATAAIDKGTAVPSDIAGTDIDGTVRGDRPDVGADEYGAPDAVLQPLSAGRAALVVKDHRKMFELNGRVICRSPVAGKRRAVNGILLLGTKQGKTGTHLQLP